RPRALGPAASLDPSLRVDRPSERRASSHPRSPGPTRQRHLLQPPGGFFAPMLRTSPPSPCRESASALPPTAPSPPRARAAPLITHPHSLALSPAHTERPLT